MTSKLFLLCAIFLEVSELHSTDLSIDDTVRGISEQWCELVHSCDLDTNGNTKGELRNPAVCHRHHQHVRLDCLVIQWRQGSHQSTVANLEYGGIACGGPDMVQIY